MTSSAHEADPTRRQIGNKRRAGSPRTRRRATNVALWVLQILLASLFTFAGVTKLLGPPEAIEGFAKIGLGDWFRYFTGTVEMVGAIGLLITRLSGHAALLLVCVMAGAIVAHLVALPPAALAVIPAVIGTILLVIARARLPRLPAAI